MMYRANAEAIRPLYEWTKMFERLWAHQLLRIKERAEEKEKAKKLEGDSAGAKAPCSAQRSDAALKRRSSALEPAGGYTQSGEPG